MFNHDVSDNINPEEAIIGAIVFFDLFDCPLTAYEIWKYLNCQGELAAVIEKLDKMTGGDSKVIDCRDGFYFLNNREKIIDTRRSRHNYSLRKIKIARRFTALFKLCPFVKAVILANSIGQNNMRDGSDIDFLIITAPRRLWLARLFCTGIAKLAGSRPTEKNKRDKICLSFYLSEERMNLDEFKLPGGDPYFFYWLRSFVLLYNKKRTYQNFLAANKLAFGDQISLSEETNIGFSPQSGLLNYLERLAADLQMAIMPEALKKAAGNSDGVVINNRALKLYLHDRRREYAEKYGKRISQIFA